MSAPIGFVGYGEAGACIAAGLVEQDCEVVATDVRLDGEAGDALRERADADGVLLVADDAELARRCPTLLSLVTSSAAVAVAESLARHVGPDHLVVDANSTAPSTVRAVAERLDGSGALVCDVAVMAAVPPLGLRVPMLASGPGAEAFAALDPGFVVDVVDGGIGAASAIKMLRSSVIKGLEALFVEFGLAAREFGATRTVLRSVTETLPGGDFEELAGYLLARTVRHAERRGHELEEVAGMLRETGVEPLVAEAGARRLLRTAEADPMARLPADPDGLDEILDAIAAGDPGGAG